MINSPSGDAALHTAGAEGLLLLGRLLALHDITMTTSPLAVHFIISYCDSCRHQPAREGFIKDQKFCSDNNAAWPHLSCRAMASFRGKGTIVYCACILDGGAHQTHRRSCILRGGRKPKKKMQKESPNVGLEPTTFRYPK